MWFDLVGLTERQPCRERVQQSSCSFVLMDSALWHLCGTIDWADSKHTVPCHFSPWGDNNIPLRSCDITAEVQTLKGTVRLSTDSVVLSLSACWHHLTWLHKNNWKALKEKSYAATFLIIIPLRFDTFERLIYLNCACSYSYVGN